MANPGSDQLSRGSDLYRLFVDRVLEYAMFVLDPEGYILSWNPGAERLKGYRADEIIGKHFSIFYPADALVAGKPTWVLEVATRVGQVEDEGWRLRKDGSRFWANVLITALRDDAGELLGFAKVTRDLTERRRADDALRQSEERFRMMVESVRDYAIFMLDPQGFVTTWNEGAQHIKGYKAHEIIGRHFSTFYPPEDVAAGKLERELSIAIQEGKYEEEGWRVRKNGNRFWANVVITPIYSPSGDLSGFAKVTRDLTERESAIAHAADLTRRNEQVEQANRAKAEFLAAMSHELRTPLNAIAGYAQLMQLGLSGPVTPRQREQLDRIRRSQQHLLGIINDILNFSRIEAGRLEYEISAVQLKVVVESVLPMVAPQAESRDVRLHEGPCEESLCALADRPKLEQILVNLLSNAVKFTPSGGEVELWCEEQDGRALLHVRDTGMGIPISAQEAIFAPFVQIGRKLSSPKEGTGLGLSISRDLARGMGGDLRVASTEGVGSTFTLDLPLA